MSRNILQKDIKAPHLLSRDHEGRIRRAVAPAAEGPTPSLRRERIHSSFFPGSHLSDFILADLQVERHSRIER